MSAPASAPQEFARFSLLPPELRLMIWTFALPGPRVLKVERRGRQGHYEFYVLNALSGLGMLHTCLEARQVALKAFEMMPNPKFCLVHPLYFNAEADTLYFGKVDELVGFVARTPRRELGGIRRIVVGMTYAKGIY